ncbi:MAG: MauE/DoxX family redox-associated membrane protein [Acidimicrobiia bacterium]
MLVVSISAIALMLLGVSGIAKAVSPQPTAIALNAFQFPANVWVVRVMGVGELVIAVFGLVQGGIWLLAGAIAFVSFAAFVASALARGLSLESCGCFGARRTPPSVLHVVYNTTAAIAIFVTFAIGDVPIPWGASPSEVVLFASLAAIGAYLSYFLLVDLPVLSQLSLGS